MEPLSFPGRINVEVTNRCNQSCTLCPRDGFTRPLGLMDLALFRKIADEASGHDSVLWLHFLGEPLLHPGLVEAIRYAEEVGVASIGLSTNATLLRGDLATALLDSGLDRLDISIDAIDRRGYLEMRGEDHFARVVGNVHAFLAQRGSARPIVGLQFMRTEKLEETFSAVLEEWQRYLGPDDFIKTIEPAPFHGAVPEAVTSNASAERPPCPWLFGALMVLQDGTVTMCGADWDAAAPVGHLAGSSIAEVWNGPEMRERRRAHEERRFGSVPLCGPCTDWHLADGSGYRNALPGAAQRPGPVTVMISKQRGRATPRGG